MKTILTRMFIVVVLIMISMAARADVKVFYGEKGTELQPDKDGTITLAQKELTGGTIIISQEDQKDGTTKVTFAVTPDKNYALAEDGLEVYAVVPTDIGGTRGIEVSGKLTLKSNDYKDDTSKRTYTTTIDSKLALWVKSADFLMKERGAKGTPGVDEPFNTDYSGIFYFVNCGSGKPDPVDPKIEDITNPDDYFYLVPADAPQQSNKRDAWFSSNYSTSDGDPGKPYLTTYKTKKDAADIPSGVEERPHNSVWIVKYASTDSGTDYYYLIHAATGKYVVYEPPYSTTKYNRKSVHLLATDSPDDKAKFAIITTTHTTTYLARDGYYNFRPKNRTSGYRFLNTGNANYNFYYSSDKQADGDANYFRGLVGLYYNKNTDGKDDASASDWIPEPTLLDAPTISEVDANNKVTIEDANSLPEGYVIRYTTDGSTPTASTGTEYNGPISITASVTINAVVVRYGMVLTEMASVTRDPLPCATPVISFNSTTSEVSITCATNGSTIHYTTDGSVPTASSTEYSSPFPITGPTTVKAIATHETFASSAVAELAITQVATPTIQDNGSNAISITTTTPDATIYYTIDGSTPTPGADGCFEYTEPLTEDVSNKLIKAIAFKENMITSAEGSGTVKLQCATPVITRDGMTFTLSCSFPTDATFYYSLNGGSEVANDGTPVSFTADQLPMTVTAVARHNDYTPSESASMELINGTGTPDDPYLIYGSSDFTNFVTNVNNGTTSSACYKLETDVSGSGFDAITHAFTGTFDGGMHTISNLGHALFDIVNDGVVKNVILDNVSISGGTNVGAICNEATGDTRIYNCGILATNSTVEKDDDGYDHISSCSSTISGSGNVGGIVGLLDGSSRVINCFSYANVSGGSPVGGIVGYNNVATTASNLKTMVMNCMFYGEVSGTSIAPIYNGKIITNVGENTGVSNFNYFRLESSYIQDTNSTITKVYNCALGAETRFLQRFEFFRHLLNSNRELAAWWASTSTTTVTKDDMMKWVMEPTQIGTTTPYPILKENGKYPSVVNIDVNLSESGKVIGPELGTLTVNVNMGSGGAVFGAPIDAAIKDGKSRLNLSITDKDPAHYNFNYYKVQLPYYNDVGTNNYRKASDGTSRVVTGWKIVDIVGGNEGSFTTGDNVTASVNSETGKVTYATPYNFADRHCTNKDLYSVSGRVFNQGAYWDVPEGVTEITIEPYWAKAAYVADAYPDVVYSKDMKTAYNVPNVGGGQKYINNTNYDIAGEQQKVYTTVSNAVSALSPNDSHTVNDYAVVLVGNVHQYVVKNAAIGGSNKYTVTTIDLDGDNEPDYSFMLRDDNRNEIHPLKWDFLNLVGLGMAQKSTGGTGSYNLGILCPTGWFETTNTALFRVTQFEYENSNRTTTDALILQGGVMEQWVSYNQKGRSNKIPYYHVGGNVWFKEFHLGCHQDKSDDKFLATKHSPVSVTGGDFDEFYLTGLYVANAIKANYADNAECYINGGRFGIVAGAAMEGIGKTGGADNTGNIFWQIQNADMNEFYAGGINAAKPVEGNLTSIVEGGYIKLFCGGPKFGDMNSGKTVTTTATGCTFDRFYGAGYGGNSYSRQAPRNHNNIINFPHQDNEGAGNHESWNDWVDDYYKQEYSSTYGGVSTQFNYQFLPMSSNTDNCARIFVEYVKFSLATTRNVTSNLTDCIINGNFYGGGNLGKVDGPVTSTLNGCTVNGDVFGAGYSGSTPTVEVDAIGFETEPYYYDQLGTYRMGVKYKDKANYKPTTYTWQHRDETINSTALAIDKGPNHHYLYTNEDLTTLGTVTGKATLNIGIGTTVTGNVYGGGESSDATGDVEVNVIAGTVNKDVYGGGKGETTVVGGDVTVNIGSKNAGTGALSGSASINNVYGGSAFGAVNAEKDADYDAESKPNAISPTSGKETKVNIYAGTVGSVYGGGLGQLESGTSGQTNYKPEYAAQNFGNTTVNMEGGTVSTAVYGGADTNGVLKQKSMVTITGGTVGTSGSSTVTNVVFGGGFGQPTLVEGDVEVNIGTRTETTTGTGDEAVTTANYNGSAIINGNAYGGSALGNTNARNINGIITPVDGTKTDVNLFAGTINGNVFGGGLGRKASGEITAVEAIVGGDVNVTLDGVKLSQTFTGEGENRMPLTGQIFGANNLNGTPKGHVKVHVKRTVNIDNAKNAEKNNSETALASRTTYDVAAVYGGGNQADYVPTDATIILPASDAEGYAEQLAKVEAAFAEVIIDGCAATSIEYVYGGGNAAAVPATEITVNGCYIIDQLFGGGNGKSTDTFTNPGADVGKYNGSSTDYGTGVAFTKLIGGQIHVVYGGSNTKGNVRKGTKMERTESNPCPLKIGEIYGAGQEAQMDGDVNIILECMPDEFVDKVFGGAKNATINGNVSLTVTSGKFGRVFGGNNLGGSINGSITVNVYEDGCEPLIIGELYGGGYNAPYSIYGCTQSGNVWTANSSGTPYFGDNNPENRIDIEVNVYSCTSIGKVFGGGYGSTATVIGNTHVYINTMQGIVKEVKQTYATEPNVYIGKIGQVFGGGNAASVKGNVTIDIGTATVYNYNTEALAEKIGVNIVGGADYLDAESDTQTSITAGIYGGGYSADVDGNVTLNIGTVNQNQGINIAGDIFGGGYGETTTVTGDVTVNIGADTGTASAHNYVGFANITGDVYGGSAKGKVNATKEENYASDPTDISATTGKKTQVNLYGGTITGNMYGGGLGEATHAADVYGPVAVNVEGGKVNNVFGCNNVLGSPKSTATVNIHGTLTPESPATYIIENVYGGGNMAAYTGTGGVSVVMTNGYVNNVFGGGLGSTAVVTGNTSVSVSGGTVSNNIYGGGSLANMTGNAEVTVSGGSAKIVYGGGNEASVSGNTTVNITGGQLNGNKFGDVRAAVFGGGFGHTTKVSGNVTVNINFGSNATSETPEFIMGDVYGGSAKGMVNTSDGTSISEGSPTTKVNLYKGTIPNYSLYGGGLGEDNGGTNDHPANVFGAVTVSVFGGGVANVFGCNNILGAPQSDVTVNISGGTISNNVYGGGNIAPYSGSPTVLVSGGKVLKNVYGGGLGESAIVTGNTSVSISGGTVSKDVYGGGSMADVTGSVNVSISGGTVTHDVYGGGALASTNTANWEPGENIVYIKVTALTPTTTDESGTKPGSSVYGLFTKEGNDYIEVTNPDAQAQPNVDYYEKRVLPGNWASGKTSASNTTTVTLTGGTVGNVYGGGLGQQEVRTGEEVTTPAVAANVYGDITVSVNNPDEIQSPSTGVVFTYEHNDVTIGDKTYYSVPLTGRVFGCNNLNGSPLGDVKVHIYSTRQRDGEAGQHSPNSSNLDYEIQAVYGGGNQADYLPAEGKTTEVTVWGCGETSIMRVYGSGNSASVPATDVTIWGSYDIGYAFGGGNGGQPILRNGVWVANEGANVNGLARITCYGGKIGSVFGGSDSKGVCRSTSPTADQQQGSCPLVITKFFAGGNEGIVDGDVNMVIAACTDNSEIEYVCGGSYKAQITGSVHLTITGGFFKSVYGGNDHQGSIGGNIVVDIEETDPCNKPIIIENLVGGGNEADFPGRDANNQPLSVDPEHPRTITVNVKSATRIDNIYGGCFMAEAKANTEVNINMVQGNKVNGRAPLPDNYGNKAADDLPANITNVTTEYVPVTPGNGISVIGYYVDNNGTTPATGVANGTTTYYKKQVTGFIKNEIGTIGNVFGGGRQGKVSGNTTVNIGTSTTVPIMERDASGNILDTDGLSIYDTENKIRSGITIAYTNPDVLGAHIDGNVYGGGNEAVVTGNTVVNICTEVYSRSDFEGISIDKNNANGGGGSVYGGGRLADVLGNTNVTMSGGYVFNGIFGGGYAGSVGDFTRSTDAAVANVYGHETHDDCIGKPVECKSGGTCTVVVDGGQIGPVEVATEGMRRMTNGHGDPVPEGWVWGGGRGLVVDPSTNPDMHFQAYVNETDVTIGGTAFILESVIGGGEFGRVLGDTKVTIEGNCQIGVGEGKVVDGKPVPYDENEFINPLTTTVTTGLKECSHYPYGKDNNGKKEYLPYDPYYDKYKSTTFISDNPDFGPASTDSPSDGKTWIGCVFGGGSGYYPYEMDDGPGYDWCRSAGWVEGNTEVIITGGHILTNVYGGNEYTDVGTPGKEGTGKCVVKMSGGTIGVPRTLDQIAKHPIACNLFGAGKGDERSHFRGYTNVNSVEVEVSGGIIYGSVFGGSEDGHVLGDVSVTVKKGANFTIGNTTYINGPIIGTWGTSYMEGNVFGAGRGFSGRDLLPGSVGGNTKVTISGGTMRGSVYGGGRLASVGIDLGEEPNSDSYGQLIDETGSENAPKYGHITIDISGGKIGTTTAADSDLHPVGGNVFGGSMGRITLLNGEVNPLWPKMAVAKLTEVTIRGTADIKNSVYGGGEYGVVRNLATVKVQGGTIGGHVFGGGYGSSEQTKTTIKAGGYSSIPTSYYTFTPMIWTGCVSGNTNVNISGGQVKKNVYGGGEFASVGLINFNSNEDGSVYNYITKHESLTDGFGLSWPYEFQFIKAAPNDAESAGGNTLGGKATVTVTNGRIEGYVFGGSKGKVEFGITDVEQHRYTEAFCANVRETEVNINYGSTPAPSDLSTANCIVQAVYGGGEDGHVYENANVKITGGLIGSSVYAGGKGESTYRGKLKNTSNGSEYETDVCSWTAGKVYGNTFMTMTGGHVMVNVYGGGNRASVGKGNYSGGADDYYKPGYGETLQGNLWDNISDNSKAFLESGKATVTIKAGTVGTVNGLYGTVGGSDGASPTGMVFGGSRGRAAQDVGSLSPRYVYAPDFFSGYTNNTEVIIGTQTVGTEGEPGYVAGSGPTIYSQVFGGGRDGHVRGSTHVIINNGTIGQTYEQSVAGEGVTAEYQRYHRGNVYGSGSGLGLWDSTHHGSSSGSVTRNTKVDIYGGTIYNNVYGGGAMSSVGPPRLPIDGEMPDFASKDWTSCEVNIHGGTIGIAADYEAHEYGGCVFGASRGGDFAEGESYDNYATTIWNVVNIEGGTIAGNVYGGGRAGRVKKDTEVNLKGGRIAHDAYGGGMGTTGTNAIAADVGGNTTVELNKGVADDAKGCVVEHVFGCNDMNGTPKGHAKVHVYATQNKAKDKISEKIAPPEYTAAKGENEGYKAYLSRLISEATPEGGGGLADDATVITEAQQLLRELNTVAETSLSDAQKTSITTKANNIIAALKAMHDYDVKAVYGGGDLAMYDPDTNGRVDAEVIIEGCAVTSIKQVYGGGNAAPVPSTRVDVKSCFIIDELFGGGNGNDNYQLSDGKWYENPGANVGYRNYTHHVIDPQSEKDGSTKEKAYPAVEDATTPEERKDYIYGGPGGGYANTTVNGGHIHTVYGGSNMKGNIYKGINLQLQQQGPCPMITDEAYSSSKSAETDASAEITLGCVKEGGIIYGGSYNANLNSDVNIIITNGHYNKIFGGNNRAGTISGKITITVDESGCTPVRIDELYAGGYLAPYSIYGYEKDNEGNIVTTSVTTDEKDEHGNFIVVNRSKPLETGTNPWRDPQINIISATEIGTIYGGGYKADVIGSPYINVNMTQGKVDVEKTGDTYKDANGKVYDSNVQGDAQTGYYVTLDIGTIGNIYGGGNLANVIGDTHVDIGTGIQLNELGEEEVITPARDAATITGNVFGGGKGEADNFKCDKAMVGKEDSGKGSTNVVIGNGEVKGSVFGGGEIGRVEANTNVTIGREGGKGPVIKGSVFGAGQGVNTHGYSGLVRGDATVLIQGNTKVGQSVYGGGEMASVGKHKVENGIATEVLGGGVCTVVIQDNAEIGTDDMKMLHLDVQGQVVNGEDGEPLPPDDWGHVFGAGKGVLPYQNTNGSPTSVSHNDDDGDYTITYTNDNKDEYFKFINTLGLATETNVTISGNAFVKGNVYGGSENGHVQGNTHVTISGGQIGNGYVQMADDGTYLDASAMRGVNRRYTAAEWAAGHLFVDGDPDIDGNDAAEAALRTAVGNNYTKSLPECASWPYGQEITYTENGETKTKTIYAPHDKFANATGKLEEYENGSSTAGGRRIASDGHTFYGNVFGGGSGYYPYKAGEWHWDAGSVSGNAVVEITGGHILTNVYGGNEMTNVGGTSSVSFGGTATLGVPRTLGQITKHPVSCYLFGAGKGDQRVFFNKQTNVQDAIVSVTGGTIYGSVFGGGEDGHVMRNVTMTIDGADTKIGTWGTSYVDGNVFGGGRGFGGDAYTAGNVAGSVTMTINNGTILGSVYGGGRLGSLGYGLYEASETEGGNKYGMMQEDGHGDWYKKNGTYTRDDISNFKRGYVTMTITGGTIGNTNEFIVPQASNIPTGLNVDFKQWTAANWTTWKNHNNVPNTVYDTSNGRVTHTKGGNVYAGGMGRYAQLDGTTPISTYSNGVLTSTSPIEWSKLGNVKSTTLTISGDPWIMGNVYGGGELGAVIPYTSGETVQGGTTTISITGGTIGTEVTGTTPEKETIAVPESGSSTVKYTFGSVYGGGMGMDEHDESAADNHGGEVKGNTTVSMSGTSTKVRASVFGGGEMALVGGDTDVTISGGEIGRNEVYSATEPYYSNGDPNPGYVKFGGAMMGNVYGAGKGSVDHFHTGQVKGNTNVTINAGETAGQPFIYHNVYGGGALASVGTFDLSTEENKGTYFVPTAGFPVNWTAKTGTATVTINGGTIGINGRDNGMVNGSSRGDIKAMATARSSTNPYDNDPYDKVAWVNNTEVNIGSLPKGTEGEEGYVPGSAPTIYGSVYGGGENGHNAGNATVNVYNGTIGVINGKWLDFGDETINEKARKTKGNVYGAGCGTDTYTIKKDGKDFVYHNPWSGIVRGNTEVNIKGGIIAQCVYGGGSMGPVGTITNAADTIDVTKAKHADIQTVEDKETIYGFGLSWPYEFKFKEGTGKATVNITGGHIGAQVTATVDNKTVEFKGDGDVYGSTRGEAGDRYAMAHLAYVKETEVNVTYQATADVSKVSELTTPCVTGSVHGSGEDGYVYGDTYVTLNKGLINHSLYGGGKGAGKYSVTLQKLDNSGSYTASIYSLIAGKVFGNTNVTMNGGHVVRSVYGGGNIASVGKGNYAGGTDDYSTNGYGETLISGSTYGNGTLWDGVSDYSKTFLNSGKTKVEVKGGIVGVISTGTKEGLPYGNVIGGSRGVAAPNITESPRYHYCPEFFSGYVNETNVIIGTAGQSSEDAGEEGKAPLIYGSVYGGGQDGHVRRDANVTVNSGEIGLQYTTDNRKLVGTLVTEATEAQIADRTDLDNPQWLLRGNVFGAGSGISKYEYDFSYDGDTYQYTGSDDNKVYSLDENGNKIPQTYTYKGKAISEVDYSSSAGSVTRFTEVNVQGGKIHRNVYGGGSLASVGAPKIPPITEDLIKRDDDDVTTKGKQSMCTVNIGGAGKVTIGTPDDYKVHYGGEVYGASRGDSNLDPNSFGPVVWTKVLIKDGATIQGNVFGGGDAGMVKKDAEVQIGEPATSSTTTP